MPIKTFLNQKNNCIEFKFCHEKKRRSLQSEGNALSNFVKEALLAGGQGTIPILRQQKVWVGGVRKMAIFDDVQYYLC